MNNSNSFHPNWASAPGNTILDILTEKRISSNEFAQMLKYSITDLNELMIGKLPITKSIALELQRLLGISVEFWLERENQYRKDYAQIEKNWLHNLPLKDMNKFGWIDSAKISANKCLEYFGVTDIKAWRKKYKHFVETAAFRTSATFKSDFGSVATWIRQGEIRGSAINCKTWNDDLFEETLRTTIRPLTRKKNPKEFLPLLIDACAECGVALVISPTPSGCRASGATMFLSDNKALLLLSFRYLSDDQFWFTFFHEAGHLILHGQNSMFIEQMGESEIRTQEENDANLFAEEMLIPRELQHRLKTLRGNTRDIINFAIDAGVSPGIVVGQLQYFGFISFKYLNGFKRRYKWNDILE